MPTNLFLHLTLLRKFNISKLISIFCSTINLINYSNPYFYSMKVYHFKHQEILLNDQLVQEPQLVEMYKDMLLRLMVRHELSTKKIFESIDIIHHRVSRNPLTVVTLLKKQQLPPFVFLACRN
jgi:hypothetical protein